jgi:hypothetical protein
VPSHIHWHEETEHKSGILSVSVVAFPHDQTYILGFITEVLGSTLYPASITKGEGYVTLNKS